MQNSVTRRSLMGALGFGGAILAAPRLVSAQENKPIQGFEKTAAAASTSEGWKPFSSRKLRVGLVGHGLCKFAAAFEFQNHPNVEIVAVSDLFPDRCDELAKTVGCDKKYPSLEELVKDKNVEAVYVATDAPSHARHAIEVLKHGKHVVTSVPAVFGSLEDADKLFEAVKKSGLKYMMFETSYFHEDLYAMRQIYNAGGLGKILYAEGEYFHYSPDSLPSYKGWRDGLPPLWYPTHADAYFVGVTGGSFTEVSCLGVPSTLEVFKPENNRFKNPFASEFALYRTNDGGSARMAGSWDTPGAPGEMGRIRGQRGSYYDKYEGLETKLPSIVRPPLPPKVDPGFHGGSHGYLMNEFVTAIIQDRKPLIDIAQALNMTVAGIVAHQSALKDGELLKIPQYKL